MSDELKEISIQDTRFIQEGCSTDDVVVKVTFPIGTKLIDIARWIKVAPPIIHVYDDYKVVELKTPRSCETEGR